MTECVRSARVSKARMNPPIRQMQATLEQRLTKAGIMICSQQAGLKSSAQGRTASRQRGLTPAYCEQSARHAFDGLLRGPRQNRDNSRRCNYGPCLERVRPSTHGIRSPDSQSAQNIVSAQPRVAVLGSALLRRLPCRLFQGSDWCREKASAAYARLLVAEAHRLNSDQDQHRQERIYQPRHTPDYSRSEPILHVFQPPTSAFTRPVPLHSMRTRTAAQRPPAKAW